MERSEGRYVQAEYRCTWLHVAVCDMHVSMAGGVAMCGVQARMRVIHKRRNYVDLYGSADTAVEIERGTATNRVGNK